MRGRRVLHAEHHREPIELRLGQREDAFLLDGILRRQHPERILEREGVLANRHLALLHRLEQGALGLLRRAVDFVRQDDVGEERPLLDAELRGARVEHARPEDVGGQHVGRELDALKPGAKGSGDGRDQQRLGEAGRPFEQQVPGARHLAFALLERVRNAPEQADQHLSDRDRPGR